ncbi:U3 small nucleolar ribonucleoprotein protein MPP10 [Anthonomus grandis grandis]|uniref:U3 small nucleolar ribonucleoprotein protein MPP10 n=1 Tax=Anthonomus grandis grandis TaxID=2921223 RepID=UPI0021662826|nr:U3 small nucleolar ribonucleoprotein protein MPP10 [Anthonomus grandis grandis]
MDKCSLDTFLTKFTKQTENPIIYLGLSENETQTLQTHLKSLYDFTKSEEPKKPPGQSLKRLLIDNFDLEQIWQQVELQNEDTISHALEEVSSLLVNKNNLVFKSVREFVDKNNKIQPNDGSGDGSDESCDEIDAGEKNLDKNNKNSDGEESFDSDIEDIGSDNEAVEKQVPGKGSAKSIVDDDFFKLNEMEAFLENEEKPKKKKDPNEEESDEDEEGSIDFFEDPDSEEDGSENDEAKVARFKDYFVAKEEDGEPKRKRNRLMEELDDNNENNDLAELKSTFELRQERLNRKIQELEEQAVREKSWHLKGEITAENRPQNSLLEEVLEHKLRSRPAPIITEQTSLQLEDIIRQRIKDKTFDSVEKKIRPVETPLEYKKKLVLDQEKSKESLAKIYEKEFLEQQASLDKDPLENQEHEPEIHKEVKLLMKNLFSKLDALSNYHFTSTPAIPELKIINNLPSLNMEEVAPVAASDAALLAPEEIRNKTKGDLVGKGEKTSTDKKRERRKKKLKQKIHSKRKAKLEEVKAAKKQQRSKA